MSSSFPFGAQARSRAPARGSRSERRRRGRAAREIRLSATEGLRRWERCPGRGSRASSAGSNAAGEATGSARDERTSLGSGPGRPRGRRATRSPRDSRGGVSAMPGTHSRRRRGASCAAYAARRGCRARRPRAGDVAGPASVDHPNRVGESDPERSKLEGRPGSRAGREAVRSVPPSRSPPIASARSRGPRSSFCARRAPSASPGPRPRADEAIFLPVATRDHRLRALARGTGPRRPGRTWVAADACRAARRFPADRLGELPPLPAGRRRSPMVHGIAGFVAVGPVAGRTSGHVGRGNRLRGRSGS
jgi:hypothetical protein